jgi:ligand-binding sensor domain-containing protein
MKKYLFLIIYLLNFNSSFSQTLLINNFFKNLNTFSGLSNDIVFDIVSDNQGCIWVATDNGLNKINSERIETYFKIDGLYSSSVLCFDKWENGIIWIGTEKGLNVLLNNKIYKFLDDRYVKNPVQIIVDYHFIYYIDKNGYLHVVNIETLENKIFFMIQTKIMGELLEKL